MAVTKKTTRREFEKKVEAAILYDAAELAGCSVHSAAFERELRDFVPFMIEKLEGLGVRLPLD